MLRKLPHRLHVLSSLETFFFFPTKICTMSSANLKVTLQRKIFQKLLEKHMVLTKHQLSLFNIYDAFILVFSRLVNFRIIEFFFLSWYVLQPFSFRKLVEIKNYLCE